MCDGIGPTIVADETLSGATAPISLHLNAEADGPALRARAGTCVSDGSARSNDQYLVLGYRRQTVTCSGPFPSVFASVGPEPAPDEASRQARFGT